MPLPVPVTVKDFMVTKVITVSPEMDIIDAVQRLLEYHISGAPVIDARGDIIGMLTGGDYLRAVVDAGYHEERCCGPVSLFMTTEVVSIEAGAGLLEATELFEKQSYRRYPVMSQNRMVGIISRRNLISAILNGG